MAARPGQHLDHQGGGERGARLAGPGAVLPRRGDVGRENTEPGGQAASSGAEKRDRLP
ncbi:hypothetical protein ACIQRN_16490 [[Kitasatospora] papulosa]|uniref:hypothetical protein n=1 Tax=[Kitasatospora] papulosa TaxID=1464011 RepID=UPI0038071B3A